RALDERAGDRAIVRVAIGIRPRTEVDRFDAGFAGAQERRRLGAVRDDGRDGRVEPAVCNRVDDRLEIAAAPGDEHGDPSAHRTDCQTYRTVRSPETTKPTRVALRSPASDTALITRSASRGAQTMIRPSPMLNVRNISSSGMRPCCWRRRKIGGMDH